MRKRFWLHIWYWLADFYPLPFIRTGFPPVDNGYESEQDAKNWLADPGTNKELKLGYVYVWRPRRWDRARSVGRRIWYRVRWWLYGE